MLIFLVGYMGCGKSTIGRTLAKQLGVRFLDMDTLLEQRCGKSVAEIFTETGETGFRQSEREVLAELTSEREAIVATGGGAPCFFDNMETMNRAGLTVYFKMSPEKLAGRLEHGKAKRPLLRDKSEEELIGFIRENVAKREKYYMQAKLIIDCDGVRDRPAWPMALTLPLSLPPWASRTMWLLISVRALRAAARWSGWSCC